MDTKEEIKIDVRGCARCGRIIHTQLEFRKFLVPIVDSDGTEWNYWALCPVTGEPILLKVVEKPDEQNN